MKKILLSISIILSLLLVGCGAKSRKEESIKLDNKKKVTVTTTFINDMVKILADDYVDIELIIPAGEDPHLYATKPEDYNKLKSADLILYHGLHFEGKMVDVLEKDGKEITKNFKDEELYKIENEGKKEIDPHFWFNIDLYKKAFTNAKDEILALLADLPEDDKNKIVKNHDIYINQLNELDAEIKDKVESLPEKQRVLITPHDAFNYFADAYGMKVMAPQGINTESEVSNKDIEKTAEYIAKNKIKAIFAESTTNPDRMRKLQEVVKSKGFEVKVVSGEGNELFSDSLAPVGSNADTYIDMYRSNIELIINNLK
ncbi:zinc ABC transporter substrate-binding protein [Helcococcus kunzii]|uniref:metal ABC transporter solute-binding protein, Zn/Mn family n=1 Tax=Helcococcus kunzii TaxID=40091 RepID=UPI001C98C6F1|nr:zinc ABC transporter substrate-binding protein [Helcococcus kunzii]QZO76773.1 zinc ABC transporter substrate-binding protein [Helcococcus kunzii]